MSTPTNQTDRDALRVACPYCGAVAGQSCSRVKAHPERVVALKAALPLPTFDGIEPKTAEHRRAAIEIAQEQIEDLLARDVGAFHFYTLNRGNLVVPLCRWLRHSTANSEAA